MMVSEMISDCEEEFQLSQGSDYVLAVDMSEDASADILDFMVLTQGVISIAPDFTPITVKRRYVDSGGAVIRKYSMRRFDVKMLRIVGDSVQDMLLIKGAEECSLEAAAVRYVYFDRRTGCGEYGTATVYLGETVPDGKNGVIFTVILEKYKGCIESINLKNEAAGG